MRICGSSRVLCPLEGFGFCGETTKRRVPTMGRVSNEILRLIVKKKTYEFLLFPRYTGLPLFLSRISFS
ncbi:hypothetical protein DLM78_05845 [Leptospira stimsonii]|uniref:Uncharacterized protein n=1 Tax=Leptospira stimsonii TaxID=2202203 RepID=A0A8B3CT71_9LEPT|nr:hypothetical protein DLM78_05845 [Leptospira stimsonii]